MAYTTFSTHLDYDCQIDFMDRAKLYEPTASGISKYNIRYALGNMSVVDCKLIGNKLVVIRSDWVGNENGSIQVCNFNCLPGEAVHHSDVTVSCYEQKRLI